MTLRQWLGMTLCLSAGPALGDPMAYLPIDKVIEADVVVPEAPPEYTEIKARLRQAVDRDPEWFMAHTGQASSLAAVPYDERLGITEAEFERFINIVDHELGIKSVGYIELGTESDMTGMNLRLSTNPADHPLNGLRYNGEEDYFVTKFGRLTQPQTFVGNVMDPEIGPWEGVGYSLLKTDADSMLSVSLRVGRREEDSREVLYYTIMQVSRTGGAQLYRVLLLYDVY